MRNAPLLVAAGAVAAVAAFKPEWLAELKGFVLSSAAASNLPPPPRAQGRSESLSRGEVSALGAHALEAILVHSEDANGPVADQRAILATLHNRVREGMAPDLWTAAVGRSNSTGSQGSRPYSTARVPLGPWMAWLHGLAADVARRGDRANGATHYIHAASQDAGHKKTAAAAAAWDANPQGDRPRVQKSAAEIGEARARAGLTRVYPLGRGYRRMHFWAKNPV